VAATMWDSALRASFVERSTKLTPETKPAWGKLTASAMVAHLNDSYRMCLGELTVEQRSGLLRYTPIKQLIIYILPFPKSVPTAPELLARCDGAVLEDERATFARLIDRLSAVKPGDALQRHPAFGSLTYKAYGTLMARHTEHHFRQFGL
jgi:hypothetical protein